MAASDSFGQPTWADSDPVNLAVDLTRAADAVGHGPYRRGTAAERATVTPIYEGLTWWQTDGDKGLYRVEGGAWRAVSVRSTYSHSHADWSVSMSSLTITDGVATLALRLAGAKTASWTPTRRQIGTVPSWSAPAAGVPVQATVRHSSAWSMSVVEILPTGGVVVDNAATIAVTATAQLYFTASWPIA